MGIDTKAINAQISRIETDYIEDCVPVISTFSNVYDVGQKIFYNMTMSSEEIKKDYYCDHICNKKSLLRSVTLMIPVLGQIAVFSYDWAIGRGNGDSLNDATPEQQNDEVYVLQFLKNPPHWVEKSAYQGNPLLNDETFMLKALRLGEPKILYFASEELKASPTFLLKAIQQQIQDTGKMPTYGRFSPNVLEAVLGHNIKDKPLIKTLKEKILKECKDNDQMIFLADEIFKYDRLTSVPVNERNAAYEETKSFWKQMAKANPKAAENLLKNIRRADQRSIVYYELIKELKNPEIFLKSTNQQKRDIITLAEFFDESKILSLSEEQIKEVSRFKVSQPIKIQNKELIILSPEAGKIYEIIKDTGDLNAFNNASEDIKKELFVYEELTNLKEISFPNIALKLTLIDDLNKIVKLLNMDALTGPLTSNSKRVGDKISNIASALPKYLSDDALLLANNLGKIKIVKEKVVEILNQLESDEIDLAKKIAEINKHLNLDLSLLNKVFDVVKIIKKTDD